LRHYNPCHRKRTCERRRQQRHCDIPAPCWNGWDLARRSTPSIRVAYSRQLEWRIWRFEQRAGILTFTGPRQASDADGKKRFTPAIGGSSLSHEICDGRARSVTVPLLTAYRFCARTDRRSARSRRRGLHRGASMVWRPWVARLSEVCNERRMTLLYPCSKWHASPRSDVVPCLGRHQAASDRMSILNSSCFYVKVLLSLSFSFVVE